MAYPCYCCGHLTREEADPGSHDICPVCFWEDDLVQVADPACPGGANNTSLLQARENYREFGASEREMLQHVRLPKDDERPVLT
ncbi:MAG: CPCC family cysteine-rich protein [Paracoccaceae bacterium]